MAFVLKLVIKLFGWIFKYKYEGSNERDYMNSLQDFSNRTNIFETIIAKLKISLRWALRNKKVANKIDSLELSILTFKMPKNLTVDVDVDDI